MSATPILDDFDMNYSEILKGRLENVSSLPTGLNTNHRGYAVYFSNKIWVWNGTEWKTWSEQTASKHCCNENIYYELISSSLGEKLRLGEVPNNLQTSIEHCNYFKVKIIGQWGALPSDNDEGIDFRNNPIYCQFLVRPSQNSPWTIVKSKRYDWTAGNTIDVIEEFIYTASSSKFYVGCSFSSQENGHGNTVIPVANYDRFWIRLTINECPKTSWFKKYNINGTAKLPITQFEGTIPSISEEGLPFDGYYEVMAFFEVCEFKLNKIDLAPCGSQQLLEIATIQESYKLIDKSGAISQSAIQQGVEWYNFSLQGSSIIYIESNCNARKISYRVTLPNGNFRQIVNGYMHIKYIGYEEGINCK